MNEMSALNLSVIEGDFFSAVISHVEDENIFYLVKSDAAIILSDIQEQMQKIKISKQFWLPVINEKFLYALNNEYFRAKRIPENVSNDSKRYINVKLIDTGETFLIPVTNNTDLLDAFYSIPEEFQNIPPLATKCKWIDATNENMSTKTFLSDNKYKNLLTFEALKVKNDMAYVNIWPYEQHADYDELETDVKESDSLEKPIFTKNEIEELYEEPLDTENALIAVQGYAARDEEYLCQFYDPKTGGCFKGSLCKLKHLPLTNQYDCRDRQEDYIDKKKEDGVIVGQYYDIIITKFISVNRFLFYFDDLKWYNKFEAVQKCINHPDQTKSYKKLSFEPEITQLVLLKDKDIFYRAKIMDVSESFLVWCIDSGELKMAKLGSLYSWIMRLNDFEYLTNEMEISNILPIKDNNKRAMLSIFQFQKNAGSLRAKITMTNPSLKAKLFNNHNEDIGELLVKEGLASFSKMDYTIKNDCDETLPL